jgi:hypothetical protein
MNGTRRCIECEEIVAILQPGSKVLKNAGMFCPRCLCRVREALNLAADIRRDPASVDMPEFFKDLLGDMNDRAS